MSRPLSSHGSQTQSNAFSAAKSLSLKGCTHQLSSTTLFVRNLRLLEFDLYEDWPAISVQTFTTKDAQQNQKKRIQCTEWALFRLFELWDPEDTREVRNRCDLGCNLRAYMSARNSRPSSLHLSLSNR